LPACSINVAILDLQGKETSSYICTGSREKQYKSAVRQGFRLIG
jgi:hypothetical protein